jgi:excisionase family DNA binding protein
MDRDVIADGHGLVAAGAPRADERLAGVPDRLLTAEQLAARWQVPKSHVYRLTREGRIPTVRLGRYYRYRLAAVEAWERQSEALAAAA